MKASTNRPSRTDWKRIDAVRDGEIDYSDIPKLGRDFFAEAVMWTELKRQITLRLDPDVLVFSVNRAKVIRPPSTPSCAHTWNCRSAALAPVKAESSLPVISLLGRRRETLR